MKRKIALLSDAHGNRTAMEAVVADVEKEAVTDCWYLGDLLMPGPGSNEMFDLLERVNTSVQLLGNWESCLLEVLDEPLDPSEPEEVYLGMLAKYQLQRLDPKYIEVTRQLPMMQTQTVNGVTIQLSHNLPEKNYGGELGSNQSQEHFDLLFGNGVCDIAVYGHVHHQMMRYSSKGQLILNPGSIGQPYFMWSSFSEHLYAQYAVLSIDEKGVPEVQFKKVAYDVAAEQTLAETLELPFVELYREQLETGKLYTHNKEVLTRVSEAHGYQAEVADYFPLRQSQ